jgi:hypothetical protein
MTEQTEEVEDVLDSTAESTDVEETTADADDGYEYVEVSNADEYWDKFDLNAYIADSSEEESEETDDAEVDDGSSDDTAFPSEDDVADAEEAEPEEPEEEIDEEALLGLDLDRPVPLSRRKAEKVVKGIIEPLRDPNTPISTVLGALAEFHPTRTQQLAEVIVNESVEAYPDDWLRSITGLDITVDQVREWAASGGREPSNPAPAQQYGETEIDSVVQGLDEMYGDDWMDPQKDGYLLDVDVPVVKAVRAQMMQNERFEQLQQELEATKRQLGDLEPQIEGIKTAQEAEFEQLLITTLQNDVDEYKSKVESASIPKVLEAKGLLPRESDAEEVKAAKSLLMSRFQSEEGYTSDFDAFLEREFSGKEAMSKAINRVGNYLTQAAQMEAEARRAGNTQQASNLKVKAAALKEQAAHEQDALTVWTRKAAAEFLDTSHVRPILTLLQQNADLQRRLQASGRPEIVGQTAAIGGEGGFKSVVQSAKEQGVNPFDLDITSILGGR